MLFWHRLFFLVIYFLMPDFALAHSHSTVSTKNISRLLKVDIGSGTSNAAVLTNVSISTANTIHYMQLFFYSSADCSTGLLGVASIMDNNLGQALTVGTHNIYLPANVAYSLATATNVGVDPSSVQCMQLYLSGNPDSLNTTNCQAFTETCNSTDQTCVSTQSFNATWSSSNSACRTPYVYILGSSNSTNDIYYCTGLGGAMTCNLTGPSSLRTGTLGVLVNNGYAYFSQSSPATLWQCPVSASNGTVSSSCTTTTSLAGTNLSSPRGLAASNNYLYVLDGVAKVIYGCSLSGGTISSCASNSLSAITLQGPRGITIHNGALYISDGSLSTNSGIFSCRVSGTTVDNCTGPLSNTFGSTNAISNSPRGITVYNNYLYFVNNTAASSGGAVVYCPINTDGSLGTCANTGANTSNFRNPNGIIIYEEVAYVVNQTGNTITQCTVNPTNGTLSSCTSSTSGVSLASIVPIGISYF